MKDIMSDSFPKRTKRRENMTWSVFQTAVMVGIRAEST
jgi:hypothetical protein